MSEGDRFTYPEHERLAEIKEVTQAIAEFLDWAADKEGVHLMSTDDGGSRPYRVDLTPLLAKWADIDLDKLEVEERAMLDEVRKAGR